MSQLEIHDAYTTLHRLERRVEQARRATSAALTVRSYSCRPSSSSAPQLAEGSVGPASVRDEVVRQRREEVLRDRRAGELLIRMREEQEREAKKQRKELADKQKLAQREGMYELFQQRRGALEKSKSQWDAANQRQVADHDAVTALRHESAQAQRAQLQQLRYQSEEQRRQELEQAHQARIREKKENEQFRASTELHRAAWAKGHASAVRGVQRLVEESRERLVEKNRQSRDLVRQQAAAMRKTELQDLARRMLLLEQELSALNR